MMFIIHLHIIVTVVRPSGRKSNVRQMLRLAVAAPDEAGAHGAALKWFTETKLLAGEARLKQSVAFHCEPSGVLPL